MKNAEKTLKNNITRTLSLIKKSIWMN